MPDVLKFAVTALPGTGPTQPGPVLPRPSDAGPPALPRTTLTWEAPAVPTLDLLPTDRHPAYPGAVGTPFEGGQYFYPLARVATRTPTSRVPAVWVEPQGDGWVLRATLQLYRPATIPDGTIPLDVELRVGFRSRLGEMTTLTSMTDETPAEPDVIRQVVVSGPVQRTWIDFIKTDVCTTLAVSGSPHYTWSDAALEAESQKELPSRPDAIGLLLGENGDLPLHLPVAERANRPVYAAVDGTAGAADDVWVVGPAGPWARGAAGFATLPHEYRLAFDDEQGLPAVTVLLLEPAAAGGGYRVRVRFHLVPWWNPEQLDQLRTDIAENEDVPYPTLVIGGYDAAEFTPSTLFGDLGGDVLDQGTTAVDAQGFELVFECSMEFYTLLCTMLAPGTGAPRGLQGHVRFTLPTGGGSTLIRDIPVQVRLDLLADGYLPFELAPAGAEPAVRELTATVRNLNRASVTATGATGTLVVAGRPVTYPVPLEVQPLPLSLAGAGLADSGTALRLVSPVPVVANQVSALDLRFTGISVAATATAVLEQVHELATATAQPTSIRVTSYQLAHPENLPAPLADVYGLEVEVRLGERAPVTVFLTRAEPDKAVGLALLIGDLLGGADPRQPTVSWRRRNLATAGTGEFSAWQTTTGRELFATPVQPAGAAGPAGPAS